MQVDSAADESSSAAATLNAIADASRPVPDTNSTTSQQQKKKESTAPVEQKDLAKLPEGDVYVSLLVVIWLIDHAQYDKVSIQLIALAAVPLPRFLPQTDHSLTSPSIRASNCATR
jgi:hypothetical protein